MNDVLTPTATPTEGQSAAAAPSQTQQPTANLELGKTVSIEGHIPTWRDTLPDDMKGSETLAKFKDVPSLAKSY